VSQCQRCNSKCQMFLCNTCSGELHDMLTGLPRWLSFLHDASVGQTRLGESARRSGDLTSPMPVNLSASALYQQVHNTIMRIVQDLCESRGAPLP
jgi:hypothetical protein